MTETEAEAEQPPRGKGRPTPKRSEAQKKRQPLVAPKGRDAARAAKSANAERRRAMRDALKTGDEKNYPAIAAGPERAAVRDAVDRRRSFGWLAIPGWFVGIALTLAPAAALRTAGSVVFPVVIGILLGDAFAARRAIVAALEAKFPDGTKDSRKSLVWYGIARNTQFRRNRLPRPKVERGS